MTKKEFQQKFGDKAVELLANPTFHIVLDVAREDCPFLPSKAGSDATSIIRHDGQVEGWMECLKFLKTIAKSEPEPTAPEVTPLYKDPSPRRPEQNKK